MNAREVEQVIRQVKLRLIEAEVCFTLGQYDSADKELLELRDVLDDIYDRPEENVD